MTYGNTRLQAQPVHDSVPMDYSEALIEGSRAQKEAQYAALRRDWKGALDAVQKVEKYAKLALEAIVREASK